MTKNIIWSILITLGVVFVATILGTVVSFLFHLFIFIDSDSARYFFSAMAQSLAALFALTFIVVNVISAFALKNLAKYVFKYIFSRKLSLTTISLFIFSIAYNFVYLGGINDNMMFVSLFFHYTSGLVASIIIFFVGVICLVIYAYTTLSVSIDPFDHFYKEVSNSFKSNLITLKEYLHNKVIFDERFTNDTFSYSHPSFSDPRRTEECKIDYDKRKTGYVLNFDLPSLNQAVNFLRGSSLLYYVGIGDKIQKGYLLYAFNRIDSNVDKTVLNSLSNSVIVSNKKPGWEDEFDYLNPMYNEVNNHFDNPLVVGDYISELLKIAENYLILRKKIFGESDYDFKGISYTEFFDYWLEGYYGLLKKSCIVKSDLIREGKIHHISDEPDFHIISGLRQLCIYLYRIDNKRFFQKVIIYIYKYSDYVTRLSSNEENLECKIALNHLDQLKDIIESISFYSYPRQDKYASFNKLNKFNDVLILEYLESLKLLSTVSKHYNRIKAEYDILKKNFIEDIVEEFEYKVRPSDYVAFEKLQTNLLAVLFSMSVQMLSKVENSLQFKERFITIHKYFFEKYKQSKIIGTDDVSHYVDLDKIFSRSHYFVSELRWFQHETTIDKLKYGSTSPEESIDRTSEFCCKTYLLTLVLSDCTIKHSKEFELINRITDLKLCFNNLKRETNQRGALYEILLNYCGHKDANVNEALKKLEKKLNDVK